ncbi:MAG: TPM domain-containing protein [Betaproteobacteria bacterium]|nr:TPM domain-containing protein [Betaproteobacteria bacterium]
MPENETQAAPLWPFQGRAETLEERTGVEIVVATVGKCDNYPEIPWKAFALSSALAAAAVVLAEWLRPDWIGTQHVTLGVFMVLVAGAGAAALTVLLPGFGRWFLSNVESEAEVRQYAAAMFLEREWFRTAKRQAVLLLVAQFERSVVVLPDIGLRSQLSEARLQDVIEAMRPRLAAGEFEAAISAGLDALETLLLQAGCVGSNRVDEIAEEHVVEKGV